MFLTPLESFTMSLIGISTETVSTPTCLWIKSSDNDTLVIFSRETILALVLVNIKQGSKQNGGQKQ